MPARPPFDEPASSGSRPSYCCAMGTDFNSQSRQSGLQQPGQADRPAHSLWRRGI